MLEVMIAISIFSVIMVTVLSILPTVFKVNSHTAKSQDASLYARTVIEQTRNYWLTKVTPAPGTADAYPYFTSGAFPSDLPTVPSSLTCDPLSTSTLPTVNPPTPIARRRLTVSCTPQGSTAQVFVVEIGRP